MDLTGWSCASTDHGTAPNLRLKVPSLKTTDANLAAVLGEEPSVPRSCLSCRAACQRQGDGSCNNNSERPPILGVDMGLLREGGTGVQSKLRALRWHKDGVSADVNLRLGEDPYCI